MVVVETIRAGVARIRTEHRLPLRSNGVKLAVSALTV